MEEGRAGPHKSATAQSRKPRGLHGGQAGLGWAGRSQQASECESISELWDVVVGGCATPLSAQTIRAWRPVPFGHLNEVNQSRCYCICT